MSLKRKSIVKFLFFSIFLLLCSSFSFAQSQYIRVLVKDIVKVSSDKPEGITVPIHYNETVALLYPDDDTFIQGVEFELKIPSAFRGIESSLYWAIYTGINPMPDVSRYDYYGNLLTSQSLLSRVSLSLIVPSTGMHSIVDSPYSMLIPAVVDKNNYPMLFRLVSVGKGLSPAMENAVFKLTIRPVVRNEGGLKISYNFPKDAEPVPVSVFIDNKAVSPNDIYYANKGVRSIRLSAEGYREEVISAVMEAGKITNISVDLVSDLPIMTFQAPSGSKISIDGEVLPAEAISFYRIQPGEHTLDFSYGDYQFTRKFTAVRGKTYDMVLSVNLDIISKP